MSPLSAERLQKARTVDRAVAAIITGGGSLILLSVGFLMVFLLIECLPLLGDGQAMPAAPLPATPNPLLALEDEYRETVAVLGSDGVLRVGGSAGASRTVSLEGIVAPVREAVAGADGRVFALRDAAAAVHVWTFRMRPTWKGQERVLEPTARLVFAAAVPLEGRLLAVAGGSERAAVLVAGPGGAVLVEGGEEDALTLLPLGTPARVGALAAGFDEVWVASEGELAHFTVGRGGGGGTATADARVPLGRRPTAMTMVLGDVTCLVGDDGGVVSGWQVVAGRVAGSRVLERSAEFEGPGPVIALAASQRDKSFLVVRPDAAEIAHLTSRRTLFELPSFPRGARGAGFSPRRDGVFALAPGASVHRWSLSIPHPEATFSTLFLPVRYEGFSKPDLVWQSTGMTSAFEAKLSLIPLVVGTFKGALYALVFSAPAALAAALYVSQFAPRRLRLIAKPTVELMAALPSVVIGFLAALLLAPVLQRHIVGTLAAVVVLPLAIIGAAALWQAAPLGIRRGLRPAGELLLIGGLLLGVAALLFLFEGTLARFLFGGDFQAWLADSLGVTYDQRNAVVVGFALGFAVIPIIFTLAEDAFSNVPPSLISASLALGATRWQAARTVAIPAASPGLFAAVVIGLGRAVGETMIVLMATGNTPLLSLSPFNGMRTMSACIAVELPEAPYGETLYRVLILTALLLFIMTFVINTLAVLVSNRLRRRFGRLAA